MLEFEVTPNYVYLKIPYDYRQVAANLGTLGFSRSRKMWKFPNNIHVMRDMLRHFPALQQNDHFMAEGRRKRAELDALLAIKQMEDAPGDHRLRPYQRVDSLYLQAVHAAGVFNEPRTGKTPTIIATMRELGTIRNIVVCPASLLINWENEFATWYPEVKVFRISSKNAKKMNDMHLEYTHYCNKMTQPFVLLISKDSLKSRTYRAWHEDHTFDLAVVDEAHFLRNPNTAQSEAVKRLNATRRYALTGTPTVKNGTDIYGILEWLFPQQFTSYWAFVRRYFNVRKDFYGNTTIDGYHPERLKELQELIGFSSVQRKREEVMSWLPPKTYISIPVDMDKKQRKLYDQMQDSFMAVDEESGDSVDTPTLRAQLTRLRQLCIDPGLLEFDAPSAKTNAIMEWLEDNSEEPVVIMSMFTSYLKRLSAAIRQKGISVGMLTGEMTNEQKGQAAIDFQHGRYQVLLCNILSAGVGFTLDRADTVIFTDKAWNPADQKQAEDRIVPIDESRIHPVNIITFPIADTVDERIDEILTQKEDLTEVINTGSRDAILALLKR